MSLLNLQSPDSGLHSLLSFLKANRETYVFHVLLHELVKGLSWTFVFTEKSMFKFVSDTSFESERKRTELLDIHSVEVDTNNSCLFHVFTFKSKAKFKFSQVKGAMGFGSMDFDYFLQKRSYLCSSIYECAQVVFVFTRLMRNAWQRIVEARIVPAPEIYQRHDFAVKVKKGRTQDRMIVLSSQWIYNVEVTHNPTVISEKSLKWALPIPSLTKVTLTGDTALILHFDQALAQKLLNDEHMGMKGSDVNEDHTFVFRSYRERMSLLTEICRVHATLGGGSGNSTLNVAYRSSGKLESEEEEKTVSSPHLTATTDVFPTSPQFVSIPNPSSSDDTSNQSPGSANSAGQQPSGSEDFSANSPLPPPADGS